MAGVVAALGSHHDVRLFRQHIDDFAFAFIAPLGAHQNCICHNDLLCTGPMPTLKNPEV